MSIMSSKLFALFDFEGRGGIWHLTLDDKVKPLQVLGLCVEIMRGYVRGRNGDGGKQRADDDNDDK